jgi:hypothetical protein
MRRLLKLGTEQPEDYHENCFVDAILHKHRPSSHSQQPAVFPEGLLAQLATSEAARNGRLTNPSFFHN